MRYRKVLTIAGSDCSGGAGIQADLKTFAALGCYGMSVLSSLTAQNSMGISMIEPVSEEMFSLQLEALFSDMGVDAIKIGMLYSSSHCKAVAKYLTVPAVLDPVFVSSTGASLIERGALKDLEELFSKVALITPNLDEASLLLGKQIYSKKSCEEGALELVKRGANAVLIKGGHRDADDCLCMGNELLWIPGMRVETKNTHGTGCSLSSAIAAYLAKGENMCRAVTLAKEYITGAIQAGAKYQLGKGAGPIHHFYREWA